MGKLSISKILLLIAMVLLGLTMLSFNHESMFHPYTNLLATLAIFVCINAIIFSIIKIKQRNSGK